MTEELGKIEKPLVSDYVKGRKLYFVPLIYRGKDSLPEYIERYNKYWEQIEAQITELELKLGKVEKIYHELLAVGGEEGIKILKDLNEKSCEIARNRVEKGAQVESTEDSDLLTELMDWGRCLSIGLQNHRVFSKVYEFYLEAGKKRNEYIAKHIDETLKEDQIGIIFMREGHKVQFPADIRLFYVAPPALDEVYRWLRDFEAKLQEESETKPPEKEEKPV